MVNTWQSQMLQVPGGGGYLKVTFTAGTAWQAVNIGFQNDGYATQLWASQAYIYNGGDNAFLQLVNSSATPTDIWVWAVLYTDDALVNTPLKPQLLVETSDGK